MTQTLARVYAGVVYDVLRSLGLPDKEFVLNQTIKPLDCQSQVFGPVYTCRGGHVPSKGYRLAERTQQEMWAHIKTGQVIVLEANNAYCAHCGDVTMLLYRQLGIAGFVTDGLVRDSARIRRLRVPCFCTGTTPIDALDYWAITEFGRPITLPGVLDRVPFGPGDYIYGDADGVLRIPASKLGEFYVKLDDAVEREDSIRQWIGEARGIERATAAARQAYDHLGHW